MRYAMIVLMLGCSVSTEEAERCDKKCGGIINVKGYRPNCFCLDRRTPLERICESCAKVCDPRPVAECGCDAAFQKDTCRCESKP
jgi:hypothetical protein